MPYLASPYEMTSSIMKSIFEFIAELKLGFSRLRTELLVTVVVCYAFVSSFLLSSKLTGSD